MGARESELARMKGYMLWPVIDWLRKVKRWFRGKRSTQPLLAEQSVPYLACAQTSEPAGKVSIIIPFKDHVELLRNCLRSLTIATYRDFEVILVNNGSTESRTRRYLTRIATVKKIRVVDSPGTFNFAHLCNAGAALASGDHLVFLNNDTEVVSPNWLQELLGITSDPKVGIAGATLLYPDRTIQHAGLFPRTDGLWVHPYQGQPESLIHGHGELGFPRVVPAVTAACLLIRRTLFQSIGGFDEGFPVAYNDVDLCTRVRQRGLLIVVTPHAKLFHYEGLSRGYTVDKPEPVMG
jgi:GT2 family glycosyltransferase